MSEISFSDNYSDISEDTGFQFEFYCEHCRDAWRTEFKRYLAGSASGFLNTAGSLLGGIFGQAGQVVDRVKDAGYKTAHDRAFQEAVEQAKDHFHRCRRCHNYFCNKCFNPKLNLCVADAPSVEEEANVAARQKEIELAQLRAQSAVESGKRKTDEHVVCPSCDARVPSSKFCSECGGALAATPRCRECETDLLPGAKFCPECGTKA